MLSRRKFLGLAGGAAATGAAGFGAWARLVREQVDTAVGAQGPGATIEVPTTTAQPAPSTTAAPPADRVLVVLQLAGGNDGLNTLVPTHGRYRDARPKLAIAESELVSVGSSALALHPSLAPLRQRWQAGKIAALQGIGFRNQSRSHFKALDTWWAGTDGAASASGWLGRWLDATEAATPNPLRAITFGSGAPALIGSRSLPTVVLSPEQFALRLPRTTDAKAITEALLATAAPLANTRWMASAQRAIPSAIEAIGVLEKARAQPATDPGAPPAPRAGSASALLQSAAGIIELGIGTRVIQVSLNGFDTHANQLTRHRDLLADVAGGITAFFDRLEKAGKADKVLLLTVSEFGRRVAENASEGTDHGLAAVQLAVGPAVKGAVVGEVALDRLVDGDVPLSLDTRSLYAIGLDWLGGPTDDLLGGRYDRYGLI